MFFRVTKLEDGTWTVKRRICPIDSEINKVEKIDGRYFVTIPIEYVTEDGPWLVSQALWEGLSKIVGSINNSNSTPSWLNDLGQL